MRNVGFVKVDQDEEACIIHIHGKGLKLEGEKELSVFLFYELNKECIGLPQGVIENVNPAVNYRLRFTPEDVGEPENYDLIQGIIMENKNHRKYAAVWDDMPVNVNEMRIWQATPEEKRQEAEVAAAETVETVETIRTERREDVQSQEVAAEAPEKMQDSGVPESFADVEAEEARYEKPKRTYKKVQRQDLASLPRCEWKLANNGFLLHGYHNYHHLILVEEEENCWLGVPGIYHQKEAKAAESFGFPQFIRFDSVEIETSEEERNEQEDFGYWCRHIKRQPQ